MVSFFRDKSPAAVFWLIAITIIVHAHFFIQPAAIVTANEQGFLSQLLQPLRVLPPILITLIYYIIVVVQALRLNYILNDAHLFSKPAYTTAISYILLTALFPEWCNVTPALIVNALLIWLIYLLTKFNHTNKPNSLVYNAGLIAGITVVLYTPSVFIVVLMFFAVAILRPFRANEWFVLLLGIITPVYFFTAIYFLKDGMPLLQQFIPYFNINILSVAHKTTIITTAIIAGLLIIVGFYSWQANNGRMIIQARKIWGVILLMLLLLIPAVFIVQGAMFSCLLLCMVPAAAFASNGFYYAKNNLFAGVLFWSTVAIIILNNWYLVNR